MCLMEILRRKIKVERLRLNSRTVGALPPHPHELLKKLDQNFNIKKNPALLRGVEVWEYTYERY